MPRKYDYDAIIIGAGISGLVCGCYLAKAGMKTLIVEKNRKPGGYCTSFTRRGFSFDACAHSIGGMGKKGIIRKIIKELDIENRLEFMKFEPFDTVISPDYKVSFWSDLDKTKNDLTELFPREKKNISNLFYFINEVNGAQHIQLRKRTLKEMLDDYIRNDKLKSVLAMLAYGNLGLPPSMLTAFTAIKFYKQFIFDGGYYPGKDIQEFPNALARRFVEYGGDVVFSKSVRKIVVKDNNVSGIKMDGNDRVTSRYV
jgi:phytoene dehydrogenase-like protein